MSHHMNPEHLSSRRTALRTLVLGLGLALGASQAAEAFVPLLLRGVAARSAAARAGTTAAATTTPARAAAVAEGTVAARAATGTSSRAAGPAGRAVGKPVDVMISRSRHPAAAEHVLHAQRTGQPSILTLDRADAAKRRAESLRYINNRQRRPAGLFDRDEYPPAMFREGGNPSSVRYIDRHDNRGAGTSMRWQLEGHADGTRVRMVVGD
jgi:hypothetical protein